MAGWPSTVDAMADKVLRTLQAYYRNEFGTLAASAAASAGSLVLTTGHANALGIGIGDVIETNAELHLVTAVATDTLTVTNAWQGTTAAAHNTGDMVRLSPRVARQDVYEAIESVILSWDNLFAVNSYEATVDWSDITTRSAEVHGAPPDYIEVLKAIFKAENDVYVPPPKEWYVRDVPNVSSGLVIQWEQEIRQRNTGNRTLTVWLSEYFDTEILDGTTDLIYDIGLSRSMLDCLYYGTMYMILMPEETQRADFDAQPQPRNAEEVPPGFLAQTALSFKALHDQRKQVEAAKLAKRWKR